MVNKAIREAIFLAGVKQWEVAAQLRIHEVTFIRKLRFEFSEDEKARVLAAIEEVKKSR